MFGKKYKPIQIATELDTVLLPSCIEQLAIYLKVVQPNEEESKRMQLSIYLFPFIATYGLIHKQVNDKFKTALLEAREIYLERFQDKDIKVNLGEAIIWRVEQEYVAAILHSRHEISIDPSEFDFNEIRYGTLLDIVANFRSEAFLTDISFGMSQSNNKQEGLSIAFDFLGISFTKHVLKIDPNNSNLTQYESDRFHKSSKCASALLGQGFFNVTDVLNRIQR